MSKATELRLLQNQRSIDAGIDYHHRSGDSEGSAGNMLDRYAQSESAEEEYFEGEEEGAREVFARAFGLYLKKTLTGKERKFLKGILAGKETPAAIGKALGVKWFECLQEIQRKAFNNAEAFGRVVQLSGWSRAQEFSETVFKRLELLKGGAELNELLPQNRAVMKKREYRREWARAHSEKMREWVRKWQKANPEKVRERAKEYKKRHSEKIKEDRKKWKVSRPEYVRAKQKEYVSRHHERLLAWQRDYDRKRIAEKRATGEYEAYLEARREQARKRSAKKKAAKALAGLMQASQEESQNNQAHTE